MYAHDPRSEEVAKAELELAVAPAWPIWQVPSQGESLHQKPTNQQNRSLQSERNRQCHDCRLAKLIQQRNGIGARQWSFLLCLPF